MTSLREFDLERELIEQLAQLADSGMPPSSVDATQARKAGARKLRVRRAVTGGGLAAVAATVSGMLSLGCLSPTTGTSAATTGPSAASSHDPLVARGDFGWLPASMKVVSYHEDPWGPLVLASADDGPGSTVWLNIYAKGATPKPRAEVHNFGPNPKVNGRPGIWEVGPAGSAGSNNVVLRWRAADGRWVEVAAQNLPPKEARPSTILRIAENVTVQDHAVPLPFYIRGLPTGAKFLSGVFSERPGATGKGSWSVRGQYGIKGVSPDSLVQWTISPHRTGPLTKNNAANRCVTRHGLDLCVSGKGPTLKAFGGIDGFMYKFALLGADRNAWTINVVR